MTTQVAIPIRVSELKPGDEFKISSRRMATSGIIKRVLRTNIEYETVYAVNPDPTTHIKMVLKIGKHELAGAAVARSGVLYRVES